MSPDPTPPTPEGYETWLDRILDLNGIPVDDHEWMPEIIAYASAELSALRARLERAEAEGADLRERLAAAESEEVCGAAHPDPFKACPWCERDEARADTDRRVREARREALLYAADAAVTVSGAKHLEHLDPFVGGAAAGGWDLCRNAIADHLRALADQWAPEEPAT